MAPLPAKCIQVELIVSVRPGLCRNEYRVTRLNGVSTTKSTSRRGHCFKNCANSGQCRNRPHPLSWHILDFQENPDFEHAQTLSRSLRRSRPRHISSCPVACTG